MLALGVGPGQNDRVHIVAMAQVGQDARKQRVGLAVIKRDVGRRPDHHHHPVRVHLQAIQDCRIGLEVGQVVLLLQAGVLEELLAASPEPGQAGRRDGVGGDDQAGQPAADVVLLDGELVVEHVHGRNVRPSRGQRQVVGAVRHGEVKVARRSPAMELAGAAHQHGHLAGPGGAGVTTDDRGLQAVELQKPERL